MDRMSIQPGSMPSPEFNSNKSDYRFDEVKPNTQLDKKQLHQPPRSQMQIARAFYFPKH